MRTFSPISIIRHRVICACLVWVSVVRGGFGDPVREYISEDTGYDKAIKLIREFPEQLTTADLDDCLDFLERDYSNRDEELFVVRQNNLADWLLGRSSTVNRATETILKVVVNEEADPLWREYCIQKLPRAFMSPDLDESLKARIGNTLLRCVENDQITIPGTALLGLYRISKEVDLDEERFASLALRLYRNTELLPSNRAMGLQVASLLGRPEATVISRSILENPDTAIQLQIAALASLSRQGGRADLPLLDPLQSSNDIRIREPARAAIQSIVKR